MELKYHYSFILQDPFGEKRGIYDFPSIQARLEIIKKNLEEKKASGRASDDSLSDNDNAEES